MARFPGTLILFVLTGYSHIAFGQPPYQLTDPELKTVLIDSSIRESFLSIRADTAGRLYVGGREALFVYEPRPDGLYDAPRECYRFPDNSWIYDIEIRGEDLYVMTNRALYLLPKGVTKHQGLRARRLIWGHPDFHPHQCLHGLAWGPDGYLYLSMGDLMVSYGDFRRPDHWGHWNFQSQPRGTSVPYTGVGGFMRCRPDGTDLQIIAGGTRNSCGLVFDRHWNLFSNDNDHEGLPTHFVPGRLLHVTSHADFGWPRGWMPELTPDRADLLQTMYSGMGRSVPVGQTYYDEAFFAEPYRNNLLVARWGNRTLVRYPLRSRGASFSTEEHVLLQGSDQTRPVGVAVGRGGRIFVTLAYMSHNEGSPVYRSDLVMITRKDDAAHHPFDSYEATTVSNDRLWEELDHLSSWRSRRALVELIRRGETDTSIARTALIRLKDSPSAHLIWMAASGHGPDIETETLLKELRRLSIHDNSDLRHQAVRSLAEHHAAHPITTAILTNALSDPHPQVQHAAIVGFFRQDKLPLEIFVAGPARSTDTYLRQASTRLLAEKLSIDQLKSLCESPDHTVRLAGILATGFRLTLPKVTSPIDNRFPLQPWSDEKVYIQAYDGETVDVRTLGRTGMFTLAEHWNAVSHSEEQERLFQLLLELLHDPDEPVRLQSAHFLSLLNDTRSEPLIERVRTVTERQRLTRGTIHNVHTVWTMGPFFDNGKGFETIHPPETTVTDLSARFEIDGRIFSWEQMERGNSRMLDFRKHFGPADGTSRYLYFRLDSPRTQQVLFTPGSDDGMRVWHNGQLVYEIDKNRGGLPLQDVIFLTLEAGSNDILMRVRNIADEHNAYLHYRTIGKVTWALPEKIDTASLSERLRSASKEGDTVNPKLLEIDWAQAALEGDPEQGRKWFSADGIGCAKCHSATPGDAATGGPSLTASGRRFSLSYLVESILLPSEKISPSFRGTRILTRKGKVLTGLVINETANRIELLTPDAKKEIVTKDEIDHRSPMQLSPMPAGLIKNPKELSDLLAYLMQLLP